MAFFNFISDHWETLAIFQGVAFFFFGVRLLLVAYRSLTSGELLHQKVVCRKNGNPIMFWLLFAIYGVIGLCLLISAVRMLSGDITLPL
jgi:hypothetical protein